MLMRLLFVAPLFYGVEKRIITELEKSGYEVVWIENKSLPFDYHGTKAKFKIIRRLYFSIFAPQIRYIKRELEKIGNIRFDILFSINGHVICPYLIKSLKNKNPDMYSVLYLWDSFSMYTWKKECRLFDTVYTFDRQDSEKYGFNYHPNFYLIESIKIKPEIQHDLFFVGKFTPDRLRLLDKIKSQLSNDTINIFFRIWPAFKNTFHYLWFYSLIKKVLIRTPWINDYILNYEVNEGLVSCDYFINKSLNFEDVQKELLFSNVILDISFSGQTGYSHRIVEALAHGKKIITTNLGIAKEKFYNPEQIKIINPVDPVVDQRWIKEIKSFQFDPYFRILELSMWLKSIVNDKAA